MINFLETDKEPNYVSKYFGREQSLQDSVIELIKFILQPTNSKYFLKIKDI